MRTSVRMTATAGFALVLSVHLIGCGGDGLPREGVSGTVTLNGQPLETGIITFVPEDPNTPTQGGTTIANGAYDIPRAQGLVPGQYKVIISSGEGSEEKPVEDLGEFGPGMPPVPAEEAIPSTYSGNTVLQANVTAGGDNRFEFTLAKSGGGGG
ncbi:hypothetical protein AB1L88_25030 [Tautonia sp. JC769]|uniref:hypothetical protein n=1 Tax=Tautonia sp. JC769 TaxID=3232135 RepID=UPI003458C961